MNLPEEFLERMKHMLGDEYDDFLKSYDLPRSYGLRLNLLKLSPADSLAAELIEAFHLIPVPWTKEGFFADSETHPGRHPLHEAGAYYIQEPSAMSVVSLLEPDPGDIVCDLCAAPGGKSTHIAGRLAESGLLVANEIFPARARILSQNIERLGIKNAVVCNEPPENMSKHFPLFFDKIVVDAPCSGEGMFRKDEAAIQEWSPDNVKQCAIRQQMILYHADIMLKPDGIMVYSTCTFAPEEDEDILIKFLREHPEYEVIDYKTTSMYKENCGLSSGRTDFISEELLPLSDTEKQAVSGSLRLFPHLISGEGHFAVKLHKRLEWGDKALTNSEKTSADTEYFPHTQGTTYVNNSKASKKQKKNKPHSSRSILSKAERKDLMTFLESILTDISPWENLQYRYFGDELYVIPSQIESIDGIRLERAGLHVLSRKKNRFEPAYALAKALNPHMVIAALELSCDEALKYLHGDVLSCATDIKGWTMLTYKGLPLGWGKASGGMVKNHYPKGLRIM